MNRRVASIAAGLAVLLIYAALPASASVVETMTLAGIGSNIDLNSFSFSVSGAYVHSGSEWKADHATSSDFTITRTRDGIISPKLALDLGGKTIPSGDIEFFKSGSPTVPYLDFHFTDGLVSNYSLSSGGGGVPQETVSFTFVKVTAEYAGEPQNPWGAVLPESSQVREGPFALNLAYDQTFDAASFGTSDILMDATIPGQRPPVPEPASLILLGSGLIGLAAVIRRKRTH